MGSCLDILFILNEKWMRKYLHDTCLMPKNNGKITLLTVWLKYPIYMTQ